MYLTYRALWRYYYSGTDAAIFVVDASDKNSDRLDECRDEIHFLMRENELIDASVLIFANKQDVPGALSAKEIALRLDLLSLRQRQWNVQACSAKSGDGIYEGLEWINYILHEKSKSNASPFQYNSNSISNENAHCIASDTLWIERRTNHKLTVN